MNELGTGVLRVLESSSLGRMSIFVLSKQSGDMGIDLENLTKDDASRLAKRLKEVLPFFLADETDQVVSKIKKLVNNGNMVI